MKISSMKSVRAIAIAIALVLPFASTGAAQAKSGHSVTKSASSKVVTKDKTNKAKPAKKAKKAKKGSKAHSAKKAKKAKKSAKG